MICSLQVTRQIPDAVLTLEGDFNEKVRSGVYREKSIFPTVTKGRNNSQTTRGVPGVNLGALAPNADYKVGRGRGDEVFKGGSIDMFKF